MNSPKLQLEDYFLTKMLVVWHPPEKPTTVTSEFRFGYEVRRHKTETRKFRLHFTMQAIPKQQNPVAGYEMECQIAGLFSFGEGTSEDEMQQLIRINGGTILYGILRGHVATVTGCFPGGKFTLPTVMMQDVVQGVEAEKAERAAKINATAPKVEKKTVSR